MHFFKGVAWNFLSWVLLFALSATAQEQPGTQLEAPLDSRGMTLAVAASDRQHHPVSGLKAEDFALFEQNQPQQITAINSSDVPACIGLLVDSSGSMRHKRGEVFHALIGLVQTLNSEDRVFVVNFNDKAYLDQDFTGDVELIRDALERADARGGTAMYDAVIAAADHIGKAVSCKKRVLVVVTDGEDNSSRMSLQQAINANREVRSPIIYGIGMPNEPAPSHRSYDRHALELLTSSTGGALFYTGNLKDLDKVALKVGDEIQNLYLITYARTNPLLDGQYRHVRVELQSARHKDVVLRVREGYYGRDLLAPKPAAASTPAGTAKKNF